MGTSDTIADITLIYNTASDALFLFIYNNGSAVGARLSCYCYIRWEISKRDYDQIATISIRIIASTIDFAIFIWRSMSACVRAWIHFV